MLKRCTLFCLLLYCNVAMFNEFDQALVVDENQELNQQPRFLREFFPFLSKAELSEDMKSLLTSLKRKRRVCHHGNKRGSHVIHFRPTSDVRTLRFNSQSLTSRPTSNAKDSKSPSTKSLTSKVLKRARGPHERHKRNINLGRYEEKGEQSTPARAKKDTNPDVTQASQQIAKRSDQSEMMVAKPPFASSISEATELIESTTKQANILLTMTEFVPTASPNQHPSVQIIGLIKPSLVPLVIQTQEPVNPTEMSRISEHSPRPKFFLDMNTLKPGDNSLASITLTKRGTNKREIDLKPKKTIKSVITKILIIPVERQIEEFGDEMAEEVDVVSLKHTRDNKKKPAVTKRKSTAASTQATTSLATENLSHASVSEESSTPKVEISSVESTIKETMGTPKATLKLTSPKGTTRVVKQTTKRKSSPRTTMKTSVSTEGSSLGSTVLSTISGTKETELVSSPLPSVTSAVTSAASAASTESTT